MRHWSLISTRSNGKPVVQLIFERYDTTRLMPSLPWWRWCKWPLESWQSSANIASNHQLNVSCGLLHSLAFMTDQILSSLDPFSTESNKEFERVPISLTRSLIVVIFGAGILSTEKWTKLGWNCELENDNEGKMRWYMVARITMEINVTLAGITVGIKKCWWRIIIHWQPVLSRGSRLGEAAQKPHNNDKWQLLTLLLYSFTFKVCLHVLR